MRLVGQLHTEMLLGLFLRGAGAVSSFVLLWLTARIFGADVVGLYQIGLTTVVFLGTVVALGLPELIIRNFATMVREDRLGDAKATFLCCSRYLLKRGSLCTVAVMALAVPFSRYVLGEPEAAKFLIVFAPAVLFLSLLRLTNALLRSTGRVLWSQSLDGVFYTTAAAILLAITWFFGEANFSLLPVWFYQVGFGTAMVISGFLAKRLIADWPRGTPLIGANDGIFIAAAPITAYAADWLLLLIVTTYLGLEEAGVYRTAFQFCMIFQLVNASFSMMAGPHLARAAADANLSEIKRIIWSASLIGLGLCLPVAIAGWAVPEWLLGLFGPEFRQGALALQILLFAQMLTVATGPVGTALVMLHREHFVFVFELIAAIAGVAVAMLLVERYQLAGIAAGPLVAAVIRRAASFVRIRQILNRSEPV